MDINDLRAQAMRLQRATGKKLSRNRTVKNIDVSPIDPRVPAERIARYTKSQLSAYMARLEKFNSRSNQYERGYEGRPLSQSKVREYKKQYEIYNKFVDKFNAKYADVFIEQIGQTVSQRRQMTMPSFNRMDVDAENYPLHRNIMSSDQFLSEKGLDIQIDMLKRYGSFEYWNKRVEKGLIGFKKQIQELNNPELNEEVKDLTMEQFRFLYEATDMPTNLGLAYDKALSIKNGKQLFADEQIMRQEVETVIEYLQEAKRKF